MELKDEIYKVLEAARDGIRENIAASGINASGRTSASIRVMVSENGCRLVGGTNGTHSIGDTGVEAADTAPVPTLEVGRDAGKVPRGFYHIIKEWSREKGIQFESEAARSTFAYFVAQKIAREGTLRHWANIDVYSTPVKVAVGNINEVFGKFARTDVAGIVRTALTVTNTPLHF